MLVLDADLSQKLLDSVVARLIEQSDLMNSYDDEVLLPCIDELSVSRYGSTADVYVCSLI